MDGVVQWKRQAGYSLVELMVAMGLGVLLSTVALQIYVEGLRTFRQADELGRMQENARFALYVLGQDVKMAGFFGASGSPPERGAAGGPADPAPDCGAGWAYDTTNSITYVGPNGDAPTTLTCLDGGVFPAAGSALGIKRVEGLWTASGAVGAGIWVETENNFGAILQDPVPNPDRAYWRYMARVYSIRDYSASPGDGIPALVRQELQDTGQFTAATDTDALLVDGIEGFAVEWGIDTDTTATDPTGDSTPNYFTTTLNPGDRPIAARLHVMVRAKEEDQTYTDGANKTYQLADQTMGPYADKYRRRIYSTTVLIRNLVN